MTRSCAPGEWAVIALAGPGDLFVVAVMAFVALVAGWRILRGAR